MVYAISRFRGEYAFLSNFFPCNIQYMGLAFQSAEAAFQASKCKERAKEFCNLSASAAKKLGRTVPLPEDWEARKDEIMREICFAKFRQNPELCRALLATGERELIEGNDHGDRYWGVCNGTGRNMLGQILMQVRVELQKND